MIASCALRARHGRIFKLQCRHGLRCEPHAAPAFICCAHVLCLAETKEVQKIFSVRNAFKTQKKSSAGYGREVCRSLGDRYHATMEKPYGSPRCAFEQKAWKQKAKTRRAAIHLRNIAEADAAKRPGNCNSCHAASQSPSTHGKSQAKLRPRSFSQSDRRSVRAAMLCETCRQSRTCSAIGVGTGCSPASAFAIQAAVLCASLRSGSGGSSSPGSCFSASVLRLCACDHSICCARLALATVSPSVPRIS